jgi:hypothetical protein
VIFERLGEDGIAVAVVEYHKVVITTRGLYWELACLIGVQFFELGGW